MEKTIKNKSKKRKNIKNNKILFGILLAIIIIVIIFIIFNKKKEEEEKVQESTNNLSVFDTNLGEYVKEVETGTKINISPKLNQDKKIEDLDVTNIQLTTTSGITTLIADVANNTQNATSWKNIKAVFLDENGKELFSAKGIVSSLNVGETTKLSISMSSNYIAAYDVEFRVEKYQK